MKARKRGASSCLGLLAGSGRIAGGARRAADRRPEFVRRAKGAHLAGTDVFDMAGQPAGGAAVHAHHVAAGFVASGLRHGPALWSAPPYLLTTDSQTRGDPQLSYCFLVDQSRCTAPVRPASVRGPCWFHVAVCNIKSC